MKPLKKGTLNINFSIYSQSIFHCFFSGCYGSQVDKLCDIQKGLESIDVSVRTAGTDWFSQDSSLQASKTFQILTGLLGFPGKTACWRTKTHWIGLRLGGWRRRLHDTSMLYYIQHYTLIMIHPNLYQLIINGSSTDCQSIINWWSTSSISKAF